MTDTTQPKALRLADEFERLYWDDGTPHGQLVEAAIELRRLYAELQRCKQVCDATDEGWKAEREALRADLERERMRLAACGVVALANTPESAAKVREMLPDYRSASCDDVARAVGRQIALRDERDALLGALKELTGGANKRFSGGKWDRARAAIKAMEKKP